jgi:hypothetical protein
MHGQGIGFARGSAGREGLLMGFEPNRRSIARGCRGWQFVAGFVLVALLSADATPCGQSQQNAPGNVPGAESSPGNPAPAVAAPADTQSPNDARQQQIADQSAQLLKLATELKAEVDKTSKDTLSLAVIRKADAIERVARGVKEKIRVDAGSN